MICTEACDFDALSRSLKDSFKILIMLEIWSSCLFIILKTMMNFDSSPSALLLSLLRVDEVIFSY